MTASSSSPPTPTLPTPCARDGKGPGHRHGLPRLVETGHPTTSHADAATVAAREAFDGGQGLLPTPTAVSYGSNRSPSPGAATRPSLHTLLTRYPLANREDAEQPPPSPPPTPATGDCTSKKARTGRPTSGGPGDIIDQLLPTPTVADSRASADATATRRPSQAHPGRSITDATRPLPDQPQEEGRTVLPTPRASDGTKGSPGQRDSRGNPTLASAAAQVATLPTPTASDQHGAGRRGAGGNNLRTTITNLPPGQPDHTRWGRYAHTVARWEALLGRPAPVPTQPGRHDKPVLAPPFVEWLMGLPEEWVCGLDLPRSLALRLLGNGVVPHQAAAALRTLLILHARAGAP